MKFKVSINEMGVKHLESGVIVRFYRDWDSGNFKGNITNPDKIPPAWISMNLLPHFMSRATQAIMKAFSLEAKKNPRIR